MRFDPPPRRLRQFLFAGALILAGIITVTAFVLRRTPRYDLLDSRFGSAAWNPKSLCDVFTWEYHAEHNLLDLGYPDFFDFQHQALLRLLDLQSTQFGHRTRPRATSGTYVDHSGAWVSERANGRLVVIGTGTLTPVQFDGSSVHGLDPYWQLERFVFTDEGELLARESWNE